MSAMSILSSTTSVEWVVLGAVALYGVNRFTLANWPLWYFLGMRGLTILFVTFAARLVMRGQQAHLVLRPTAPCRPSTYPDA
jgi:hypothetical protein